LNKEIYGIDFDINDLKHNYTLTLDQKLNLELSLKQVLPLYLRIPEKELRSGTNENMSFHENIENNTMQ
jgi:hypothetical protein